jgi:hypothetical protein
LTSPDDQQDRVELDLLLRGFEVSRMLRLVADLEIADKIEPDDVVPVDEVAAACAVLPHQLVRVLRALAACGVFRITPDGSVAHTKPSRLLRTDVPNSMHHSARFWTAPGSWAAWAHLDAAMTDGVPHEAAWHEGRFEYLRTHPDEARIFDRMMANFPDNRHAAFRPRTTSTRRGSSSMSAAEAPRHCARSSAATPRPWAWSSTVTP